MAQIEHNIVKNASRKTLNRLRQIGMEKAKRLEKIQECWENGGYSDVQIVVV